MDTGVPDSTDNDAGEANPTDDGGSTESGTGDGSDGATCPGAAPVDAGAENVAQGGGVFMVTNCGNVSVNEMPTKAFDNDTSTKWLCFLQNAQLPTIEYRFVGGATFAVNAYTVTSANDAPERDPGTWRLEGSNDDGATWTSLDQQVGQSFPFRGQTNTYTFSNCVAYARYRFVLTALTPTDAAPAIIFQVAEIQLFGAQGHASSVPPNQTKGGVVTTPSSCITTNLRERPPSAYDRDFSSKWFCGGNGAPIVDIALTASRTITAYSVVSGDDNPDRDPKNWLLQGSNDGATWTQVDSQTDQVFANRIQTNLYSVAAPAAFTRYRFRVNANNGSIDFQVGEIMLFGN
jgi:hypothetical protein